jgi:pilus assembly protein Flp/PilA
LAPIRRLNVVFFKEKIRNEKGQGLTEYALLLGLIAIAAVAVLTLFGTTINNTFYSAITDAMQGL